MSLDWGDGPALMIRTMELRIVFGDDSAMIQQKWVSPSRDAHEWRDLPKVSAEDAAAEIETAPGSV